MSWFEAPTTDHLKLLARYHMRIHQHLAGIGVLAKDEVLAAVTAQFPAFRNSGGAAHAFDNNVSAVGPDMIEQDFASRFGRSCLFHRNHGMSAEFFCEVQSALRRPDDDRFRRSRLQRNSQGCEAHRATALNNYNVAQGHRCALKSVKNSCQSASSTNHSLSWNGVGDSKD